MPDQRYLIKTFTLDQPGNIIDVRCQPYLRRQLASAISEAGECRRVNRVAGRFK